MRPRKNRPIIEELEARVLYSGDLAPGFVHDALSTEARLLDEPRDAPEQSYQGETQAGLELVVVDARVDHADSLLAGLDTAFGRRFEVVRLGAGEDGVGRVGDVLRDRADVAAVHFIAHGEAGRLQLGATWLDTQSLAARAGEIAAWREALGMRADILIYGCDVGAGVAGQDFVTQLAALTGADVAASDDLTGSAGLGGDWDLEARVGVVDPVLTLTPNGAAWQGLLNLVPASGTLQVNTTESGDQYATPSSRQIAMDGLGNFVAVWTSKNQDGSGEGIFAQRFASDGSKLGGEIQVNSYTSGVQDMPAIAMNGSGAFVVVWQSQDQDGSGYGILARRFDAAGIALGGELQVNSATANDQTNPSVGIDAAGDFVVAWQSNGEDSSGLGVYARRYDAGVSAWGTAFRVNSTTSNDQYEPAVAMNAGGAFVIAWTSENQDVGFGGSTSNGVYARLFDASGNTVKGEFRVSTLISGDQYAADVAMNDSGAFVVVLTDTVLGEPNVGAFVFDATGNKQSLGIQMNQTMDGAQQNPSVAISASGDFIVAWESDGQDGDGYAIVARHFKANYSAYQAEAVINLEVAKDQLAPSVAWQGTHAAILWSGRDADDSKGVTVRLSEVNTGPNTLPRIISDGGNPIAAIAIPENTTAVTTVTAVDTDLPVQVVTYAISGGADAALFDLDTNTGVLAFKAAPDYETPLDVGADNVYEVTVQALDGLGGIVSQIISISITPVNEFPPVITSNGGGDSATVTVAENATAVTTVTATDADLPPQTLTYGITGIDAGRFSIDSLTGELRFASAPDYEAPADTGADNVYELTVIASDGAGGTDTQTLSITVTPVNDNVPVIGSDGGGDSATLTVAENSTAVTTVTATDADLPAQTLAYAIAGGDDAGLFQIDAATGDLRFAAAPDYETPLDANGDNVYEVTVSASDGAGGTDAQALRVVVANSIEQIVPGASSSATAVDATTLTWSHTVADRPYRILVVDVAVRNDVAVTAVTYGGAPLTLLGAEVDGGAKVRAEMWYLVAPAVGAADVVVTLAGAATFVAGATDFSGVDQIVPFGTVTLAEGTQNPSVTVASAPGELVIDAVADKDIDDELVGAGQSLLWANKTGSKNTDAWGGASAEAGASSVTMSWTTNGAGAGEWAAVVVALKPTANTAPYVTSNGGGASAAVSVAENTSAVTTVTAMDADLPAQSLSYSIAGGADAARFQVDAGSGELSFKIAPDYEAPGDVGGDNVYEVLVQVSDGAGGYDTQSIAVTVTPVNDSAPVIASDGGGSSASMSVAENATAVTTVAATDADLPAQTLNYSISGGADAALFRMDASTGVLVFKTAPNYEMPADSGVDNVYEVVVSASDGGATDTQTLSIAVTDVIETITTTPDSYTLAEDQAFSASVAGGWYDAAWSTRQFIGLSNASGPTLTDTAVLVTLTPGTTDYARMQSNGQDLRFVDQDGTVLDYEIDAWSPTGTSRIWVRVPSVDAASNADGFWLYYGNTAAPAAQNPAGVWGAARAVLHMGGTLTDSSASANTVTQSNTLSTTGQIGDARLFNGTSGYVSVGSATAVDDLFAGGGTLSAWIYPTAWGEGAYGRIAAKSSDVTATSGWAFQLDQANQSLLFEIGFGGQAGRWRATPGAIDLNAWQHVAVVYNSSSSGNAPVFYLNGVALGQSTSSTPIGSATSDAALALTVGNQPITQDRTFSGSIDEFRAYTSALTGDQIAAEYRAGAGVLTTLGAAQTQSPGVLNNDSASDGSTLTAELVDSPAHAASFTLHADGTFDYTPIPDYAGTDSFTYVARSGASVSVSTLVQLTIVNSNDAPVITSNGGGASVNLDVAENVATVTTVSATDIDLPAQTLIYTIAGGADAARFAIDASTGVLSFVPAPNYEAPTDSGGDNVYNVTVRVSDGVLTDIQDIAVTVMPVNDNAPVITSNGGGASATLSVSENTTALTTVTATDADRPAQTLTYAIEGGADASLFQIDPVGGVVSFNVAPNFEAPIDDGGDNVYDIVVRADDGSGVSDTQSLAIHVLNVDEATILTDDAFTTDEDTSVTGNVLANDSDPDNTLAVLDYVAPAHGTLDMQPNGAFTYTPATNYFGTDAFSYVVSDGTEGRTHYWTLDGHALDSVGGANGSVQGAATIAGHYGQALSFDGTDYVTLPDVSYANEFTLSFWFNISDNSGTGYRYLYSHGDPMQQDSVNVYLIEHSTANVTDNDVLRTRVLDNNDSDSVTGLDVDLLSNGLIDGEWHQYTLTVQSGVGSKVYVDGVLKRSLGNGGDAINPSGGLYLGARNDLDPVRFHQGGLDTVQLFAGALGSSAVSALYSGSGVTGQVSLTINAVNDPPVVSPVNLGNMPEDGSLLISQSALLAGSSDAEGTTLAAVNLSLTSGQGSLAANGDGSWTFSPDPDWNGSVSLAFGVSDGQAITDNSASLTVTPVNDAPVITSDGGADTATITVAEGTAQVTTLTATDADLPSDVLTWSITGGDDAARFSVNSSSGALSFRVPPDYETPADSNGDNTYEVTVRVSDGALDDTQTLTVIVVPANDNAPVITSDGGADSASLTVDEGTTSVTTVTATDADQPPQTLSYAIVGGDDAARFTIDAASGALGFAVPPDYEAPLDLGGNNVYDVIVQVSDGNGASDTQTLSVKIAPVNEFAPVIDSDGGGDTAVLSRQENALYVTTVTATDADRPSQTLTYAITGGADAAKFDIDPGSGQLSFLVAPDFEIPGDANGDNAYEVVVRVDDGDFSDSQSLTIQLQNSNDNGVGPITDIEPLANEISEAALPGATVGLRPHAVDPDAGDTVTYSLIDDASGRFAIDAVSGVVTLVGAVDYDTDTEHGIVVQATSSDGSSNVSGFTVNITPVNDNAPVLEPIGNRTVTEGNLLTFTATATDADVPPDTLTYSLSGEPAGASIDPTTGVFTWTPTEAQGPNTYTFDVIVSDGQGGSDSETIQVTVTEGANQPPVLDPIGNQSVTEGTELTFTATASDPDVPPGSLTYSLSGEPAGASIDPSTGVFTWTPTEAQGPNTYSFDVIVSDGQGGTDSETLQVTVTEGANQPPVLDAIGNQTVSEGTPLSFTTTASDPDVPPGSLTYSLSGQPSGATIDPTTGVFTWTPTEAQGPNTYSFDVIVSDGQGGTDSETLQVTVTEGANQPPVLDAIGNQSVTEGTPLSFTASATDPDVPPGSLTYSLSGAPAGASIDPTTGVFTWTPTEAQGPNTYTFDVIVSDGQGGTDSETIQVTVTEGANQPPVLDPIGNQTVTEGTPLSFTATATDPDVPPGSLTYSLSGAPAGASIDPSTGVFTWTPTEAQGPNTYTFDVIVSDGQGGTDSETLTIFVENVNVAPVGVEDRFSGEEDGTLSGNVLDNDSDPDADTLRATLVTAPAHGRLVLNADGSFDYFPDADYNGPDAFTYRAGDGALESAPANVSLDILPVNDAPSLIVNSLSITGGGHAVLTLADLDAGDIDSPPSDIRFIVDSSTYGHFELAGREGVPVTTFGRGQVAAGEVVFVSDDSEQTPAYAVRVDDGIDSIGPYAADITFTAAQKPETGLQESVEPLVPVVPGQSDTLPATAGQTANQETVTGPADEYASLPATGNEQGDVIQASRLILPGDVRDAILSGGPVSGIQLVSNVVSSPVVMSWGLQEYQMNLLESLQVQAVESVRQGIGSAGFTEALDRMRDAVQSRTAFENIVIGSSVVLSGSLSIGYVLWLLRGGALLGSLLSALPAWAALDPVPVLAYYLARRRDGDDDDDFSERMFEKKRATAETPPPEDGAQPDSKEQP